MMHQGGQTDRLPPTPPRLPPLSLMRAISRSPKSQRRADRLLPCVIYFVLPRDNGAKHESKRGGPSGEVDSYAGHIWVSGSYSRVRVRLYLEGFQAEEPTAPTFCFSLVFTSRGYSAALLSSYHIGFVGNLSLITKRWCTVTHRGTLYHK